MADTDAVTFRGQLSKSDFRTMQSLASHRANLFMAVMLAVWAVYLLVRGHYPGSGEDPVSLVLYWLPPLAMFPLIWVVRQVVVWRHWAQNKLLKQTWFGTVSAAGLEWNSDYTKSTYPWDVMRTVRTSKTMVLIYTAPNTVFFFPRSFFANEEDWVRFNGMLAGRLPKRAGDKHSGN